ncbi:hypothetical protein GYMLUDRAFT_152953 [Collybiopsis luxurians FD-317 M1]|nr:hypothetical protein GYMLUDRAFT_152953 [Collybiopsis luxurians FD-317 M1]
MSTSAEFQTIDVFTQKRFRGNPLAVILANSAPLTPEQRQLAAREFNLSETIFIHRGPANLADFDAPFTINIHTINEELPFAGHPTIGAGWVLSQLYPTRKVFTLSTKAGKIPVTISPNGGVKLQVPIDFKEHAPFYAPQVKSPAVQPRLQLADYVNGVEGPEAVASIVKGMTFMLFQLSSVDSLSRVQPLPSPFKIPAEHLGAWAGFSSLYVFVILPDVDTDGATTIRTRMFEGSAEDPATGSAASTLCGWLGRKKGPGSWKFRVIQGVEMGRESHIGVFVDVGSDGEVVHIDLVGEAVKIMEGTIQF